MFRDLEFLEILLCPCQFSEDGVVFGPDAMYSQIRWVMLVKSLYPQIVSYLQNSTDSMVYVMRTCSFA